MSQSNDYYETLDHTADLAIRILGRNMAELFRNAALAIKDLLGVPESGKNEKPVEILVQGMDLPDLMINWLKEILYLYHDESMAVWDITIREIKGDREMAATISALPFPDQGILMNTEIKAVTYHGIKVENRDGKWVCEVVFDT